jgi:hypothetical protein
MFWEEQKIFIAIRRRRRSNPFFVLLVFPSRVLYVHTSEHLPNSDKGKVRTSLDISSRSYAFLFFQNPEPVFHIS